MRVDIAALRRFYASPLGDLATRMCARRLHALWDDARGLDVLGLGYATPFLERYRANARRVVALMPAAQGAAHWPEGAPGLCALTQERRLPVVDSMFDRVVLAHALEEAEDPRLLLREVWRVTAPEGRIVVLAANRSGLWARAESTPFGHGRPYSRGQLSTLLSEAMFEPTASARALYAPPIGWRALLGAAEGLERVGETLWPAFGGVVLMEAQKRLTASPGSAAPSTEAIRARLYAAAPRPVARAA